MNEVTGRNRSVVLIGREAVEFARAMVLPGVVTLEDAKQLATALADPPAVLACPIELGRRPHEAVRRIHHETAAAGATLAVITQHDAEPIGSDHACNETRAAGWLVPARRIQSICCFAGLPGRERLERKYDTPSTIVQEGEAFNVPLAWMRPSGAVVVELEPWQTSDSDLVDAAMGEHRRAGRDLVIATPALLANQRRALARTLSRIRRRPGTWMVEKAGFDTFELRPGPPPFPLPGSVSVLARWQ